MNYLIQFKLIEVAQSQDVNPYGNSHQIANQMVLVTMN